MIGATGQMQSGLARYDVNSRSKGKKRITEARPGSADPVLRFFYVWVDRTVWIQAPEIGCESLLWRACTSFFRERAHFAMHP